MMLGFALSPMAQALRRASGGAAAFDPASEMFGASEQGAWYDPSYLISMFQDSNGLVAAAVGQPVGRLMDRRIDSVYQETTGIVWTKTAGDGALSVSGNQVTITGATTPTLVSRTAGSIPLGPGLAKLVVRADYTGATGVQAWIRGIPNGLSNGVTTTLTAGLGNSSLERLDVSTGTVTFTVASLAYWRGNHATQGATAQKPVLRIDGNAKHYLEFDGIDDSLATLAVSFTTTAAVSLFAGVRKISDAAIGTIVELSASIAANNGAFLLSAPDSAATATYSFDSKGTLQVDAVGTGFAAPLTSVLSASAAISADSAILRINGVQVDSDIGNQGTGNYGNYPIYIGRRGSATLPLNGSLYGLIVRGATTDAPTTLSAETYINSKTGAY